MGVSHLYQENTISVKSHVQVIATEARSTSTIGEWR